VIAESLKLTTYFGERDRAEHARVADALLDLYGSRGLATSVMLRGITGFGLTHSVHTDQLLTLSEDLPVVTVAIDTPERIDTILPEVTAIQRRGLVTLERARTLTDEGAHFELPLELASAAKLTVYVGRAQRAAGRPAFVAVCELLHRHDVAGATVLLGVDGTVRGERRRAQFFSRNTDVPMMIVANGPGAPIAAAVPELRALVPDAIVTLERIQVCMRDGVRLATPAAPASNGHAHGLAVWQKLMIHSSEATQVDGRPLHRALIERLRRSEVAGATNVRGVWGFHGDHAPHGDKLLQRHRHTPVVTIVIDTPERIATVAFPIVEELTATGGLVTCETVPAARAAAGSEVRGGTRLAPRLQ
jgi:PII-like signaling protein